MTVLASGNVGIGTASPFGSGTTQLGIQANGAAASSNYASLALNNPNTNTGYTWGSLDFYGGPTLAAIRGVSISGTLVGSLAFYGLTSGGTFTNLMTLAGNQSTANAGTLTLGIANGTVSTPLAVYDSAAAQKCRL